MNGSTAKAIAAVLLTIGAMTAGVGLAAGLAEAQPAFGTFVAPFPAGGPWTWCPLVQWDMSECHTW